MECITFLSKDYSWNITLIRMTKFALVCVSIWSFGLKSDAMQFLEVILGLITKFYHNNVSKCDYLWVILRTIF